MEKAYLVAGLGLSGIKAAAFLIKKNIPVILFDENEAIDTGKIKSELKSDVEICLGSFNEELFDRISVCVVSPGIPTDTGYILKMKEKKIRVISEIELAFNYDRGKVAAITGTNGKTTTTSLVYKIMCACLGEEKSIVAGNIGVAYTEEVERTEKDTMTALEVSSFQLESMEAFKPHVSAVLNITPDHLNRHHSIENYIAIKESIARNQTEEDFIVLNYEDRALYDFAFSGIRPKPFFFSSGHTLENGFFLKDNVFYKALNGTKTALFKTGDVNLLGICNYENILAALCIAYCLGLPEDKTYEAVKNFKAVSHRIEFAGEIDGVYYYDDSKGTNPDAAIQGIRAMVRKTVLIGGGYDKGNEFDEWIEAFGDKVKRLVLIGQTADKIEACAYKHGFNAVSRAGSLEEAMNIAKEYAAPGDAVLLSPACASWGMFRNYEERGDIFKEIVRNRQSN